MSCSKVKYHSRSNAQAAIDRLMRRRKVNLRIYSCGDHFHLTSQPFSRLLKYADLRTLAAEQGRVIAAEETAELRRWAQKQAEQITAEMEDTILAAFREALVLRLIGEKP